MAAYNTCPLCGDNLDPGEKCECQKGELITVEQLPVIVSRLHDIKLSVARKTEQAASLAVTKENKQDAKTIRSELNKEFEALETLRKSIKNAVMDRYNEFEKTYNEQIKVLYKNADVTLKQKIDDIETQEKQSKINEFKAYFTEYASSLNINICTYENVGLNVTLGTSLTAGKKAIKEYLDKIHQDLNAISSMAFKEEILLEYKQGFDFADSVQAVNNRHKAVEELKVVPIEVMSTIQEPVIEKPMVEESLAVPIMEEKELTLKFTVKATKTKLLKLKQFLIDGGYQYE